MCLYSRMICNSLGIYPVMGLLGQMAFLVLDPWAIITLYSTRVELIYTSTNNKSVPFSLQPRLHLLFFDVLVIAILTGVKWFLIVVLPCISLMINVIVELFKNMIVGLMHAFLRTSVHLLGPLFNKVVCFYSCKFV